MTFERHRILSADFIGAVEQADTARMECIGRILFFWRRGLDHVGGGPAVVAVSAPAQMTPIPQLVAGFSRRSPL
jgi:hypothetical protein